MQKSIFIQCILRDENDNIVGSDCASGTTEDDGVTCVVPIGYLPNIQSARPGDLIVTVQPPPTILGNAQYVNRVDDSEAGTSVITINPSPGQ